MFIYTLNTYLLYIRGDDDAMEREDEKFMEKLHQEKISLEENIKVKPGDVKDLEAKLETMKSGPSPRESKEEEHGMLEKDIKKFNKLIEQLQTHVVSMEKLLEEKRRNWLKLGNDFQYELNDKGLTPAEVLGMDCKSTLKPALKSSSDDVTPGFGNGFQETPKTSTTNGIPSSLTPPSWDGFASWASYLFSWKEYFDSESKQGKKLTEQDYSDMVALHCSPVSNFSAYVSPEASTQLAATTTWGSRVTAVAFGPTCGGSVIAIVIVEGQYMSPYDPDEVSLNNICDCHSGCGFSFSSFHSAQTTIWPWIRQDKMQAIRRNKCSRGESNGAGYASFCHMLASHAVTAGTSGTPTGTPAPGAMSMSRWEQTNARKNGRFSGGFDINVFQKVHKTGDISQLPDVSVALVTNTIEDAKKPTVAAVQGLALGGGLELAMGCHACVAAPRAQLGLPELSLGVMPVFGGSQRLPRLLGLSKTVEMMLSSKPILSEEGGKLGLVDAIVPPQELLKVAKTWALDIAEARKPWARSLHHTDKIGSPSEALPKVTDVGLKPRSVKKVIVIGGGLMWSGIATALILGNIKVVLKDVNSKYLQKGLKITEANVKGLAARKKLLQGQGEKALSLVNGVLDYSQFKDVDMVTEAVIENIPLKKKIFSDIENICPPHCILATNTSTIDLNLIGEKIKFQDRVIGAHFFSSPDATTRDS
ncbi:unnamed protein product [Lactuca saligna]|uniref:3-hydroxyacyl-CoA dehydrogenase NAD binding domain-containing protein n=1 Tax=Lactuca saligna TaxID=75948 RepID=A0AA35VAS9_LACSI|nr:unnamed protein product [Lactuca saligna]